MIIGTQLSFAAKVLREETGIFAGRQSVTSKRGLVTLIMQVIISLAVLGAAGFLLGHPTTPAQEKAVWAAVGVVIGYWLR